jgi:hypothetical protein
MSYQCTQKARCLEARYAACGMKRVKYASFCVAEFCLCSHISRRPHFLCTLGFLWHFWKRSIIVFAEVRKHNTELHHFCPNWSLSSEVSYIHRHYESRIKNWNNPGFNICLFVMQDNVGLFQNNKYFRLYFVKTIYHEHSSFLINNLCIRDYLMTTIETA